MSSARLHPTRVLRSRSGFGRLLASFARTAAPRPPADTTPSPTTPESLEPSGGRSRLYLFAEKMFGIDIRSLALFRICLALLMLSDLLYRAQDMQAHYTDAGVMPIALVSVVQQQHWYWSIHTMHPALPFEVGLFVLAGLFALSLLVGYRTRTVSVICWLLLISLQNRNTMVLTGGDQMLRMLAFWGMFLPLGVCWSVDRALDKSGEIVPPRIFSMGSIALLVQLASIYLFGALLKSGPTWHTDNTAVFYSLSMDQFSTPLALSLLHYHDLLKVLTILAYRLELLAPLFLLASAFSGLFRTLIVFLYVGFHISLGLTLELGLFPVIGAFAWLVLLPSWFWETLFRLSARLPFRFAPTLPPALLLHWPALRERLRPQRLHLRSPRLVSGLVAFYLVYILAWNVRVLDFDRYVHLFPRSWNWIGEVVRVDQYWALFAPDPMMSHGWVVVPAILANGQEVDLKTDAAPVNWNPPPLVSATYYNERWRKYLMNICEGDNQSHCFTYASYLGNHWNQTHPPEQRVKKVSIYMVRRTALPNYQLTDPERVQLFIGEYP